MAAAEVEKPLMVTAIVIVAIVLIYYILKSGGVIGNNAAKGEGNLGKKR